MSTAAATAYLYVLLIVSCCWVAVVSSVGGDEFSSLDLAFENRRPPRTNDNEALEMLLASRRHDRQPHDDGGDGDRLELQALLLDRTNDPQDPERRGEHHEDFDLDAEMTDEAEDSTDEDDDEDIDPRVIDRVKSDLVHAIQVRDAEKGGKDDISVKKGEDDTIKPFVPGEAQDVVPDLVQDCQTFDCIATNLELTVQGDKLRSYNIVRFAGQEFGNVAYSKLVGIFRKIHFTTPVVNYVQFEQEPSAFKTSGYTLSYMGIEDGSTLVETIYSAERDGHAYITTGFTFPAAEVVKAHYDRIKKGMNAQPPRLRRSLRAASSTATFLSIISILTGFTNIPHMDFLTDGGDIGIRAVQQFRLTDPVWQSVKPIVDSQPTRKVRLSGVLEHEIIQDGVLVVGGVSNTGECNGNVFCTVLTTLSPKGSRLILKYDPGYNSFDLVNLITTKRITAAVANWKITSFLVIQECGFFIEFGPIDSLLGFTGTTRLVVNGGQELRFKAEFGKLFSVNLAPIADAGKAVLAKFKRKPPVPKPTDMLHSYFEGRLAMIGFWKSAFLIPFVHFGNIHIKLKFDPVNPDIKFVAFGGELWLGTIPNAGEPNNQIKGAVYGGLNFGNPLGNYFYASVSEITFGSIVRMMTNNEKSDDWMPAPLRDTGIRPLEGMDAVAVSFAFFDTQVQDVSPPLTIKSGLRVQGMLSLLGFTVTCDVTIDYIGPVLEIYMAATPLNLAGGLLKLHKSKEITDVGPTFTMNGRFNESKLPVLDMGAYASFLGISREIQGKMNDDGFMFSTSMNIWGLFRSYTSVEYFKTSGRVRVFGDFSVGKLYEQIEDGVADKYKKMSRRRLLFVARIARRRLGFFSWIKKTANKVKDGVVAYGKSVVNKFKKAGAHIKDSGKKFAKGDIAGGFGSLGKATLTAATALIPIDVLVGRITYDLDLQHAVKEQFKVEIEIQIKVLESKKSFKLPITINLAKPMDCVRFIIDATKGSFAGLIG